MTSTLAHSKIDVNQETCDSFFKAKNVFANELFSEPYTSLSEVESRVFEGFSLICRFLIYIYLIKHVKNRVNL